jgi:hypothetical protein
MNTFTEVLQAYEDLKQGYFIAPSIKPMPKETSMWHGLTLKFVRFALLSTYKMRTSLSKVR